MDKDKIGSIPHFAHQDKLKMDVKKKKSHRSWKKNLCEFLYNLGKRNLSMIENPESIQAT